MTHSGQLVPGVTAAGSHAAAAHATETAAINPTPDATTSTVTVPATNSAMNSTIPATISTANSTTILNMQPTDDVADDASISTNLTASTSGASAIAISVPAQFIDSDESKLPARSISIVAPAFLNQTNQAQETQKNLSFFAPTAVAIAKVPTSVEPVNSSNTFSTAQAIDSSDRVKNTDKVQQPHSPVFLASSFLVALSVYAFINVVMAFSPPIEFDQYRYLYPGWPYWVFKPFREGTAGINNVALLGSSLIVSAINSVDANYANKELDLAKYHSAKYLDDQLKSSLGGDFQTYNLSAPGQVPSDAYLYLKTLVRTAQRPNVVIYGLAPRDFVDSSMGSPADTEPFQYLKRLLPQEDILDGFYRTPMESFQRFLEKSVYLYKHSLDLKLASDDACIGFEDKFLPRPQNAPYFTYWDRNKMLPHYKPGEVHPSAMICGPIKKEDVKKTYMDNTREYKERYHKPDPHTYKTQFYFLHNMTEFCHREGIELILVNMPLSTYNVHLLKPEIYFNYVHAMRIFSAENNVALFDMADFTGYDGYDYHDSAHLNAFGGKKFLDRLIDTMTHDTRTSRALRLAGEELKHKQAIAALKGTVPQ